MSDPCEFQKEILKFTEDISATRTDIKHILSYIDSGRIYRRTVLGSTAALILFILSTWKTFSVNDYRVGEVEKKFDSMDSSFREVRKELYGLNHVKGQQSGYVQAQSE